MSETSNNSCVAAVLRVQMSCMHAGVFAAIKPDWIVFVRCALHLLAVRHGTSIAYMGMCTNSEPPTISEELSSFFDSTMQATTPPRLRCMYTLRVVAEGLSGADRATEADFGLTMFYLKSAESKLVDMDSMISKEDDWANHWCTLLDMCDEAIATSAKEGTSDAEAVKDALQKIKARFENRDEAPQRDSTSQQDAGQLVQHSDEAATDQQEIVGKTMCLSTLCRGWVCNIGITTEKMKTLKLIMSVLQAKILEANFSGNNGDKCLSTATWHYAAAADGGNDIVFRSRELDANLQFGLPGRVTSTRTRTCLKIGTYLGVELFLEGSEYSTTKAGPRTTNSFVALCSVC